MAQRVSAVLKMLLRELHELLETAPDKQGGEWGYSACGLSRRIHVKVWESRSDPGYVRDEVIPCLQRLRGGLSKLAQLPPDKMGSLASLVPVFGQNVDMRIWNLRNYIEGKSSAFEPGDPLTIPAGQGRATGVEVA